MKFLFSGHLENILAFFQIGMKTNFRMLKLPANYKDFILYDCRVILILSLAPCTFNNLYMVEWLKQERLREIHTRISYSPVVRAPIWEVGNTYFISLFFNQHVAGRELNWGLLQPG